MRTRHWSNRHLVHSAVRALVLAPLLILLFLPVRAFVAYDLRARRRRTAAGAASRPGDGHHLAEADRAAALAKRSGALTFESIAQPPEPPADGPPSSRARLKEALAALTAAGASEGEVRRSLEAFGAAWISSDVEPRVVHVWTARTPAAAPRRRTLRIARSLRFQFPRPRGMAGLLRAAPATITVDFDAHGRAVRERVHHPRFL